MQPDVIDISRLISKRLISGLTAEEEAVLDNWSNRSTENKAVYQRLNDPKQLAATLHLIKNSKQPVLEKLKTKLPDWISEKSTPRIAHRVQFLKTAWFRYAAAVIIIFGIGAYLLFNKYEKRPVLVLQQNIKTNDILPGTNKAILTLSTGEKVNLNNTIIETISDGNLSIKNRNGELVYKESGNLPIPSMGGVAPGGANSGINPSSAGAGVGRGATAYNMMTTPRGGQYQLTLSDGTKVWLNAESELKYPAVFSGDERKVEVRGEAYFEIAKNKQHPFIVQMPDENITVLGTEFNVNAYPEAKSSRISLVNGAVKVNDKILQPGDAFQQGKITKTNIEQDIAWKNGVFNFNNKSLRDILNQLGRWYDLDIEYKSGVKEMEFGGEIPRNLSLLQVLKVLSGAGVEFELSEKKLKVKS
jgi:transmembrane sensor